MQSLISVIINVYNGEKYIAKCLESILNQTYKNLEIIIVNDGSTDYTLDICQRYPDNRIRIINQKNMGLSYSRNVGIENSHGEYIFFVDSDDFIEKDTIEYLYFLIQKDNTLIATCKCLDIFDYNFTIKKQTEKTTILSGKDMLKKLLLSQDRTGTIWNKLIKKDLFDNIRFENRIINDVVVTYKLFLATPKISYSNQVKYFYLRHSDSILGRKDEKHLMDLYNASIERYFYIKNIFSDLIENEICLISIIITLYDSNQKNVQEFLETKNALKLARKLFSFRILICKMKLKDKIKILLFEMSPNLYKKLLIFYLKTIKRKQFKS